nr:MAG TPA: hypothetical protein [Bacteriophage sp.]
MRCRNSSQEKKRNETELVATLKQDEENSL